MSKVLTAAQIIRKRISHADHVLAGVPSERQLAEELGLSRDTIRSAVRNLLDQGVLVRQNNGRLDVAYSPVAGRRKTIGFITTAEVSADHGLWAEAVDAALDGLNVTLRPVTFLHWEDSALHEALTGFDAVFFVTPEKIPGWLLKKIGDARCRVVVLDQDESPAGLPSVTMFPVASERKLFEHLYELGHRRIDCINTQTEDAIIQGRIDAWRQFVEEKGIGGQLRSWTRHHPMESAYAGLKDCIREGRSIATAILCTTGPAAIGAMRALYESGLEIGRDVSVCTVNDEKVGRFQLRTLTTLDPPPRARFLRYAVEWMLGDEPWSGPLLIQPDDVPLFIGESTGPAPSASNTVMPRIFGA